MDITTTLLYPLADAFLEVGVFAAVLIAGFGWLRWRYGDRLLSVLEAHRSWAPLAGALLGVSPGCAGAILVMPLYARGTVSFGTAVAALVATMGDASWVLMAADPTMAAVVHGALFATGAVTGYCVDALGIAPATRAGHRQDPSGRLPREAALPKLAPALAAREQGVVSREPARLRREATPTRPSAVAALRSPLEAVPAAFWLLASVGFLLAVPTAFQAVDPLVFTRLFGGVDPYLFLGVAGTASAVVLFAGQRGKLADDTLDSVPARGSGHGFTAVLRHGAHETSFIVVWVAAIYLAWSLLHALTGFDGTQLPLLGVAGVVVGALVGLVPGCAVQIVVTGLYVSGVVPAPTLLANAVSQDGDALLPLLALEKRSALLATCVTTVPALVVGGIALLLT